MDSAKVEGANIMKGFVFEPKEERVLEDGTLRLRVPGRGWVSAKSKDGKDLMREQAQADVAASPAAKRKSRTKTVAK